jgi:hypothetical protein
MEPDNMDTPKQESKKKEKKKTKAQQVPSPITNEQLTELIKDALAVQVKRQVKRKKTQDELEAMVATCEEFMNSFIILGYDFDGNPVEPIIVAHSQQEADSLGSYLNKFISSQIQKHGG